MVKTSHLVIVVKTSLDSNFFEPRIFPACSSSSLQLLQQMASSEIDISKLSVEQLDGLRRQTESVRPVAGARARPRAPLPPPPTPSTPASRVQEIKNLTMSLNSLREAQARFLESAASLSAIPSNGQGACGGRARRAPDRRRDYCRHAPRFRPRLPPCRS